MNLPALSKKKSGGKPVYLVTPDELCALPDDLPKGASKWIKASGFKGTKGSLCLVPDAKGGIACALYGLGRDPHPLDTGKLAKLLPEGDWRLVTSDGDPSLAGLGWLLGAYRFDRYKESKSGLAKLVLANGKARASAIAMAEAVYLTRDLINTPTNDMGPAQLEDAIRKLAARHKAKVTAIRGDTLLKRNFPMVHAVGRASPSAPRIVDLKWGKQSDPKVTLVGKGVCFDTGGLNIKPGDSMSLMKKDMGGAANVLGLAQMIMAAKLPVRLRVIIPAVENAISGNSFRPGDILESRKGISVEIGNTDAEGRLVLGDALAWGDEEAPQLMLDMATLTGAARVALGPDLPAMFTDDDVLADDLADCAHVTQDPLWRMPLWPGYRENLSSAIADISHISKGPFAGAVTAALFLQRFVEKTQSWAHFDIYGWTPSAKPWAPVGGEAMCIRALYDLLAKRFPPR